MARTNITEATFLNKSKFNSGDYIRIMYCGVENESLMLQEVYDIGTVVRTNIKTKDFTYSIMVNNELLFYKEHQLRHATKDEILEHKICP